MERRLKILWHSNAPHAPSGYGNQTYLFVERLADDYDIAISCFYGLEGEAKRFVIQKEGKEPKEVLALPRLFHPYSNDVLGAHMNFTQADVCLSLIDPFALHPDNMREFRWGAWVPVDCSPMSTENGNALTAAKHLWSMSAFGHQQLQHYVEKTDFIGGKPTLHYVPHGVDSKKFSPTNREEDRNKLNKAWNTDLSGKFLVVTVAANKGYPGRKNWPGMFMTMAPFLKANPDAVWYLHTSTFVPQLQGDDILQLAEIYRISPQQIIFTDVYQYNILGYPQEYLNSVYNAADVFLLMSFGEGFGIPIMEAQMAGCPVIVTDGTSMTELCLAGDTIPSKPIQALDGRQGTLWADPFHHAAVQLLTKHYALWQLKDTRLRTQARDKALAYDVDTVYSTYMKPAVDVIAEQVFAQMSDSRKRRKRSSMLPMVIEQPNGDQPQEIAEKSA